MAPKTKSIEKDANYLCTDCNVEYSGNACPECGNNKNNLKLAPDGIDQQLHKKTTVFGNLGSFKPANDLLSSSQDFAEKAALQDMEEMNNNMRASYVLKSEIKKKELEMQALPYL